MPKFNEDLSEKEECSPYLASMNYRLFRILDLCSIFTRYMVGAKPITIMREASVSSCSIEETLVYFLVGGFWGQLISQQHYS